MSVDVTPLHDDTLLFLLISLAHTQRKTNNMMYAFFVVHSCDEEHEVLDSYVEASRGVLEYLQH